MDLESDAYKIDEKEIEPYRNEVRKLSDYMIEKTKTSSGKFEHVVNPDDSSAFRSSTHSQDKTTEQKSENIKVVDLRDEEDETKGRSKTEPKEWNEDDNTSRHLENRV